MQYEPLRARDLEDLASINLIYLDFLAGDHHIAGRHLERLPGPAGARLRRLGAADRKAFACCPFLLCSLQQIDVGPEADGWRTPALLSAERSGPELVLLMSLALLRRMSRRRLFAVRLVSGTNQEWCRALSRMDDPALAGIAHAQARRLAPVHVDVPVFWSELLTWQDLDEERRSAVKAMGLQLLQLQASKRPTAAAARQLRIGRHRRG